MFFWKGLTAAAKLPESSPRHGSLGCRCATSTPQRSTPTRPLVGIPVPVGEDDNKQVKFCRPAHVTNAQVLCFDDLNRAQPKVLNAVFELIQFRAINGERLPNLTSVIGVINPVGAGYQVQELDPALVDRFHVYLRVDGPPDRDWFTDRFGKTLGSTLVAWYMTDLDEKQRPQISHRRLEYIGQNLQDGFDPRLSLPPNANLPLHLLEARIRGDDTVLNIEDFVADPDRFTSLVTQDLNVASRFANLLPMMAPKQKVAVKWVLLALPAEWLAYLQDKSPFVFNKTLDAVARAEGKPEAEAYRQLLNERLPKPVKELR